MNRILAGLLIISIACYYGTCFGSDRATGEHEPQNSQDQTEKTKRVTKKIGPFEIGGKRIAVIIDITEYEGQPYLYHSFEIIDAAGVSHYKKELESTPEDHTNVERIYKLEGKIGEGLIIYFETEPSAPQSGKSFQIFGIEKGKVKPLSLPISVYGELQPLPAGKSQGALRLFDGDLVKVEQRKDLIRIVVPLVVDLQKLTIVLLRKKGIFDINIGDTPNAPGTDNQSDIKFYKDHNINSKVKIIYFNDVKKVEFLKAYADVQLKNSGGLDIDISNLWLKVRTNGRDGWVHDINSIVTLGIGVAG